MSPLPRGKLPGLAAPKSQVLPRQCLPHRHFCIEYFQTERGLTTQQFPAEIDVSDFCLLIHASAEPF